MDRVWTELLSWGRSLVAVVVGFAVVVLVNFVGGLLLESLFLEARTAGGVPLTAPAQGADLVMLFLAGLAGAFVVVLMAPRAPWVHALVFGLISFAVDFLTVVDVLAGMPLWYKVILLVSLPVQVWLGAKLALVLRARTG